MCLHNKMTPEERKKIKDGIGREGIKVYKVVGISKGKYYPPAKKTKIPYEEGLDEAVQIRVRTDADHRNNYLSGFHFFMSKNVAEIYFAYVENLVTENHQRTSLNAIKEGETFRKKFTVIECIVKKSWITMIGEQLPGENFRKRSVVVSKKAIFPKKGEVACA